MAGVVHMVPVGHTTETLLGSIKEAINSSLKESLVEYPISKVVFIVGENEEAPSEKKARKVADEVEKVLGIIPCQRLPVNLDEVSLAAFKIIIQIREEQKEGRNVVLNLSGSLRTVDIAGYMAASITGSEVIIGLPAYENGKITGIRTLKHVPIIPIAEISPEKLSVLGLLSDKEYKTLDDLAKELRKESEAGVDSLKSKISFHLKDLRKKGLVEEKRDKKILSIRLSGLGKVYYVGFKK